MGSNLSILKDSTHVSDVQQGLWTVGLHVGSVLESFTSIFSLSYSYLHFTLIGLDSVYHILYVCVRLGPLGRRCQERNRQARD